LIYLYAFLNRNVFRWVLKQLTVSHRLMLSGRELHIRGAACLNDLSPSVFEFVLGICSNEQSSDLKWWLPSFPLCILCDLGVVLVWYNDIKTSQECDIIYTLYIVNYCKKIMPKYALIQNIGLLTCLLCHLLHFRRFSDHFVEPGLYCISSNITLY
jgi:hypothetical protein